MYRKIIILIVIVVLIFGLDYTSQGYTEKTTNSISDKLSVLKLDLKNADCSYDSVVEEINNIYDQWNEYNKILVLYIEHNELEKVETNLVSCKSLIESGQYDLAIAELEKTVFVLKHISDKYQFNLENIF